MTDGEWHAWPELPIPVNEISASEARTLRAISQEAIHQYTAGWCNAFALALHERTGWPIHIFQEERFDIGDEDDDYDDDGVLCLHHAWCTRPDGKLVDIRGVLDNPSEMLLQEVYEQTNIRLIIVEINSEYREDVFNEAYHNAMKIIDENPAFFGIDSSATSCRNSCCDLISQGT